MWVRLIVFCTLFALTLLAAAPESPTITIAPNVPVDVPGGAEHADLRTASRFAWQQFIALNWPARAGVRDTPAAARRFGERGGPVVWETFRSKVEIYPGTGSAHIGPHGSQLGPPGFGYDVPPRYVYDPRWLDGQVRPCPGQEKVGIPAWINLDEISQVGFDHMYAGVAGDRKAGAGDASQLIRFTSKANRAHYRYVVERKYWYASDPSPFHTAAVNFIQAVSTGKFPPQGEYVSFRNGTMEAKAAFRKLTREESASGRFYSTRVRYYSTAPLGEPCYREDVWGLLALHIIQKTPSAPTFTWATFEQADNIRTAAGPVEDDDGAVIRDGSAAMTPPLRYQDGTYEAGVLPLVSADGPYCTDPGTRLYFHEISVDPNTKAQYDNTPSKGFICVGGRQHRIPSAVIEVNREAHRAMAVYARKHGLPRSPWQHYKLVNVQTWPFDKSQIAADDNSARGCSTYYTSNIVVETDYTLQNNSGGPATRTGGAPSDLATNFTGRSPQPSPAGGPEPDTYQNTYVLQAGGTFKARYNMGGCTGCHGLTQLIAGSDFSYLLSGSTVREPETPEMSRRELAARYLARLGTTR